MQSILGESAALAAAVCFSIASIGYTLAGRKLGATVSMALSLKVSLLLLLPIHYALQGEWFPLDASPQRWLILGASSLAGFVISATLLLRAFQAIGPRLTMLIGTSSPVCATLIARVFLGQVLPVHSIAGIALVLGGVLWVVAGDRRPSVKGGEARYGYGLLTALGAAMAQGASFVLMSAGVADDYPAMSASLIRSLTGVAMLWVLIIARPNLRERLRPVVREPRAMRFLALASIAGPALGTTLVLLSLQFTSVGVSSTLTGTTPIILIPLSYLAFRERVTARAVAGACLAIAGVAVLFAG